MDNVSNSQNVPKQYKTIKFVAKDNTIKELNFSIFKSDMKVDKNSALGLFNENNDGVLDEQEIEAAKQKIVEFAGEDGILDENEILGIFGIQKSDAKANEIVESFKSSFDSPEVKGKDSDTDNAQPTVETIKDKNGVEHTIAKYPDGKVVDSYTEKDSKTGVDKKYTKTINPDKTSEIVAEWAVMRSGLKVQNKEVCSYDAEGRIQSKTTTQNLGRLGDLRTESSYVYGANGKISEIHTKDFSTNNQITSDTVERRTYNEQNQEIKRETVTKSGVMCKNPNTGGFYKTENTFVTTVENEYNANGKISKTVKHKENQTQNLVLEDVVQEYNADGKLIHRETKKIVPLKGKAAQSSGDRKYSTSVTDIQYDKNGKISSKDTSGVDDLGHEYYSKLRYSNGELSSCESERVIKGTKTRAIYEGENLNNRIAGGTKLASEVIEYEKDGVTVKQRTVNHFDDNGVYIGRDIYDKDNKLIKQDKFELDGKIDLAMQVGRGDCYLLAAINSFIDTPLEDQVFNKQVETITDPNTGKKSYKVSLPGAAEAREALLNGSTGVEDLPALTNVSIQGSYEITEDELMEAAKQAGKKYSCGDKDVLLMELVYEKYRADVAKTMADNKQYSQSLSRVYGLNVTTNYGKQGDYLSGGKTYDAVYVMTGLKTDGYQRDVKSDPAPTVYLDPDGGIHLPDSGGKITAELGTTKGILKHSSKDENYRDELIAKIVDDCKDGKLDDYLVTCSMNISQQVVNGQTVNGGGHAFTITKMTEDEVTILNPWYPDKPIVMSMKDFKAACTGLYSTPINNGTYTEQPVNPVVNPQNPNPEVPVPPSQNEPVNPSKPPSATNPNNPTSDNTLQGGTKYTVPKGKGYTSMIKEALKAQGIPVTPENIKKAKKQFEAANPKAVKTYRGSKKKWRGNRYLIANTSVKIPKFNI